MRVGLTQLKVCVAELLKQCALDVVFLTKAVSLVGTAIRKTDLLLKNDTLSSKLCDSVISVPRLSIQSADLLRPGSLSQGLLELQSETFSQQFVFRIDENTLAKSVS